MEKSALKSDEVFNLIKNYLSTGEGKDLLKKVGGIFQVDLLDKKGGKVVKQYTIDLKNGSGSASEGPCDKANATFIVSDEDFYQICTGKLNPQMAFIQGKMKIKGSMSLASKFTPDLFPKATPENIAKYAKPKL
jgi:putative sterol carrier protein